MRNSMPIKFHKNKYMPKINPFQANGCLNVSESGTTKYKNHNFFRIIYICNLNYTNLFI